MIKYNYKGAAELWKRFDLLLIDPWELDQNEKRNARRLFMYEMTHGGKTPHIEYITERIDFLAVPPVHEAILQDIKDLEKLATDILLFKGVR